MTQFKVNNRPAVKTWNGLLNDLFGEFENTIGNKFNGGAASYQPVNIVETEEAFHLEVAAPGRKKEHFSLKVENDQLTVGYEDKTEAPAAELKFVRKEFKTAGFSRSFSLNEKVNADGIQAKYEDGILKVLLPKKAETKPEVKQIAVG